MTSINFGDSQYSSMELYSLQIQKVMADFGLYDVVSKQYVDSKISDLVGGADATWDTLQELKVYLTTSGVEGGLVAQITAIQTNLAAEVAARVSADATLQSNINAVSTSLATESAARQASDVSHSASIATLSANLVSQVSKQTIDKAATDLAISNEVSARVSGDGVLREDLDAQISKQGLDLIATNTSIADEALARFNADNQLRADLSRQDSDRDTSVAQEVATLNATIADNFKQMEEADGAVRGEFAAADTLLRNGLDAQITKQGNDFIATNTSIADEALARFNADTAVRGEFASADSALEAKPYSGSGFGVGHNGVLPGDRKYLYFSDKWRLHGSADGSRLVFEYFHDAVPADAESGQAFQPATWKTAVPFISS